MKNHYNEICYECGISANVLTCLKRYKFRPKQLMFTTSTYHKGVCDVCHEEKDVTEARDYFHPDFELLIKKMKYEA